MPGPMNLSHDDAGTPAEARSADSTGGVRRPNQRPSGVNVRQAGQQIADRIKEARASEEQIPTRRPTTRDPEELSTRRLPPQEHSQEEDSHETAEEQPATQREDPPETPEATEAEEAEEEAQQAAYERLDEFAEAYGIDIEDLRGLKTTVKVNGEDVELDIGKALDNYRLDSAITQKSQRLSAREREIEQEYQQTGQVLHQTYQGLTKQLEASYEALQAELSNPQIAALEQSDPASYLWWQKHIGGRLSQIAQKHQEITQQAQAQQQQDRMARLQRERARLREAVPDWSPEKKTEALSVLNRYGIEEAEAQQMDHRGILAALRIAELEKKVAEYEAKEAEAKKGARRIVNQQAVSGNRPGPRGKPTQQTSRKKVKAAVDQVSKSGGGRRSRAAAASAFTTMLREGNKRK